MRRSIIIFIILLTNSTVSTSQNILEVQILADKYYEKKQFSEAFKLYERFFYFKDTITSQDFFLLGNCKYHNNSYNEAIYYYNLGINHSDNDTIKAYYYIRTSKMLIYNEQYSEAIQKLLIAEQIANATQIDKIKFLIASAYFLVNDYSSSQKYFSQIIKEPEKLSFLFSQTEKKYPNPNTAFWLSTILPGLGQFYVGDIKDGLNSLLLNSSLAILFVYTANESSLISASLSIAPWLHRYLTGGATNAKQLAFKKREENNKLILNRIVNIYSD